MIRASTFRKFAFGGWGLSLTVAGALLVAGLVPGSKMQVISSAEARIGRPLTPISYAGVARRTTRRAVVYGGAAYGAAAYAATPVVVQSTVVTQSAPVSSSVVASPPPNCPAEGAVFVCGGYAYQPVMQGSTVVYAVHPAQ